MFSLRRWYDRLTDRRPVVRIRRNSYRKSWWRRTLRAWVLLALMAGLIAVIVLLLPQARVLEAHAVEVGEQAISL